MSLGILRSTVREIAEQLARGDYEAVVGRCAKSRLSSDDLCKVIRDYGRKFVSPPADAYNNLDMIKVKGADELTWSVRAPLWSEEEGRSDLTVELTIAVGCGAPSVELDDLRVL